MRCRDLDGTVQHLDTEYTYLRDEPYAVTVIFRTRGLELPWTFGRDLLAHGLEIGTGEGDVRVWPGTDPHGRRVVSLELTSPDGHLVVEADLAEVSDFVADTMVLVPVGTEGDHLDLDSLVEDFFRTTP